MTANSTNPTPRFRAFTDAEFGAALQQLRERKRLYQTEVAAQAGMRRDKLHMAEQGQISLLARELSAILAALGADFQVLHLQLQGEGALDQAEQAVLNLAERLRRETR